MSKLSFSAKPCPFCGSTDLELQEGTKDREGTPVNLTCVDCGAEGPWAYADMWLEAEAVRMWNERVQP